jgi:hypothetical protein
MHDGSVQPKHDRASPTSLQNVEGQRQANSAAKLGAEELARSSGMSLITVPT